MTLWLRRERRRFTCHLFGRVLVCSSDRQSSCARRTAEGRCPYMDLWQDVFGFRNQHLTPYVLANFLLTLLD